MFVFPRQKRFNVGGVNVGGQMNNPCVLVGTIFYEKESLFSDKSCNTFDRKKAEVLLNKQDELSDEVGCPCMVDVYASTEDTLLDRLAFVADKTEKPFMIDSTDAKTRLAGVRYVDEAGLSDRTVYNSINAGVTQEEINALRDSGVNAAIVLAFNPVNNSLNGKLQILEDGGGILENGLLEISRECGIKKPLLDTGVTSIGNNAGSSVRAVTVLKAKFGLPTGNGVHNVVSAWSWVKNRNAKSFVDCASNALVRLMGADFILYGPIEYSERVYDTIALVECLIGEAVEEMGLSLSKKHPSQRLS